MKTQRIVIVYAICVNVITPIYQETFQKHQENDKRCWPLGDLNIINKTKQIYHYFSLQVINKIVTNNT
jgi:hypothetical protein